MRAATPQEAHQARLITNQMARQQRNPQGNYDHSEFQWGYVDAINVGPPPSVNLYLDGSQNTGDTANLTLKVAYVAGYIPVVGDTVLVRRGTRRSSSDRVVIGKLNGSTSPYPLPLGGVNASGQYTQGPNAVWGGVGVPPNTLGASGDYYFRTDTPGTAGQRLYVNVSGSWTSTAL